MLLSEATEQTFDHRSEVVQAWCNELNKQLPKGYEAVIGINESTCGAQAPIPCIDVFNRDYKPTGQFVLEVARHPLYIGFEDKNTGDWTKNLGESIGLCFYRPGTRGIPTREVLKENYNLEKTIKRVIDIYIYNKHD